MRREDRDWHFVVFEQRVVGDEHAEGNVLLKETTSFRKSVDAARARARELSDQGHECKVLDGLRGRQDAFGYRVTEQPSEDGKPGAQFNLIAIRRQKPSNGKA